MLDRLRDLKNQSGFMRYFKNTSWVFGEKILQIFASLFVGVWVARYLGPENLGILSYAQSFVGILLAFSTLGLDSILVRELVKNPSDKNRLLGTAFGLQTLGSVILIILLITGIGFTNNDRFTDKIIILLGTATFFQSFTVISKYFQSIVHSKTVVSASVISLVISSALKVVLILLNAPLIAFVYVILSDSVVMALGLVYFYTKNHQSIKKWAFSRKRAKDLIKDSWPLILSGIVVSIYMKIDQVMIKEMMDSGWVGQYAAAVRLSESWYFIPTVICSSLFPAIVNAKKNNENLYYRRLQQLYDLMVYVSLSIAIPMTFLSGWVVNLLYGSEFHSASAVLSIHIWAGVFVFLGVSRGGWIINENLQRYSAFYLGAGMVTNLVLNFILIPKIGIIGAAWATLISQSVSVLFAPLLFKKTRLSFYMMTKSLFLVSLFRKILK